MAMHARPLDMSITCVGPYTAIHARSYYHLVVHSRETNFRDFVNFNVRTSQSLFPPKFVHNYAPVKFILVALNKIRKR